jgi:S1-C subfamily serine protease
MQDGKRVVEAELRGRRSQAELRNELTFFILLLLCIPSSLLSAAEVPKPVLDAQAQRVAAIAKATQCTISVFAKGGNGGGSGVLITPDGYALTNFHVVKPCGDHMLCSLPNGKLYDAVIVGIDPVGDVALIKLLARDDFPTAVQADSDKVAVGDWCFAVGNPFLLATDFQPTVTYGIVSGVHRYQYPAGTLLEYADCIQTDAAINPGNSGGPLFNAQGDLIGINGRGSFEKRGRVNVGVGYAISLNQIKHFMGDLRSGRIVDHATLGASVATDSEGRVTVTNILESSDAYRRGLRYGDEVTNFAGRPIGTTNAFKNALGIFPKGFRVPLTYRRQGEKHDIWVRLAGVHSAEELLQKIEGPAPAEEDKPKRDPRDPDKEKKPMPMPLPIPKLKPSGPKLPEHVAKLIKAKSGYANYYFNELERDRVWKAFTAKGDFTGQSGAWKLKGQLAEGGEVEFTLTDDGVAAKWAGVDFNFDAKQDFDTQLKPNGSGGVLVALHVWRRLLVQGPTKYGDVYYHGAAPLIDQDGLCDVLVGTHNVVETRFLFGATSGELAALEMYPDTNVDPCEICFRDYRPVDGRQVPHLIEVRHGDRVFAVIKVDSLALAEAKEAS